MSPEKLGHAVSELLQQGAIETIARARSFDFANNDTRILEIFQMLTHGGLGQGQAVDDLAAEAFLLAFEEFDDLDTYGMAHGFADVRQFFGWEAAKGATITARLCSIGGINR